MLLARAIWHKLSKEPSCLGQWPPTAATGRVARWHHRTTVPAANQAGFLLVPNCMVLAFRVANKRGACHGTCKPTAPGGHGPFCMHAPNKRGLLKTNRTSICGLPCWAGACHSLQEVTCEILCKKPHVKFSALPRHVAGARCCQCPK